MPVNESLLNFVKDQLSTFGEVETKKMFGGVSFYKNGLMFGLLGHDIFHLKADDINRPDYEARGMTAFLASAGKKGLPYYQVPAEVLEDRDELKKWAAKAYQAAVRAKK